MSDLLARTLARAARNRKKYNIQTELGRILSLPVQDFSTVDLVDKWTTALRRTPNARPLRQIQAEILEVGSWSASLEEAIGLLGFVGTGQGKTLAYWLLQEVFDAQRPVLLLPPSMRDQYDSELFSWSQDYNFRLPTVVYYSQLSQPNATALLRELNPDLLMADEAHRLRHATAARTKRFLRFMKSSPETRFVAMSGSLTGSALSDYAHLASWSLREYSPLPKDDRSIKLWGSVLNADGEPDDLAWQSLAPLDVQAARRQDVGAMRRAFHQRKRTTPGLVVTTAPSCDAAINMTAVYPPISQAVVDALKELKEDYILPNGLEIVDALHFHRAASQLSNGFYYIWDWPADEVDHEWVDARRLWASLVRGYLTRYAREGCDSPFLVEEYVRETHRSPDMWAALEAWDAQKHKPPPPTRPIWIDPSPVIEAYEWSLQRERALVWYQSKAVGDLLEACGLPRFDTGQETPDPDQHPRAALSIAVFYEGRNMPEWHENLITEVPSSGIIWGQLMGRSHRPKQLSEWVGFDVHQQAWPLRAALGKALARAEYMQELTGEPHKLLMASRKGWK